MQIAPNKVVSLTYTLVLENGDLADQATDENPFTFIHGIGQTLELFDSNLAGLKKGENFDFSISAEEGYGESFADMVIDIDRNVFNGEDVPADLLTVGNMLPMQDQDGNPMNGIVLAVDNDKVTMDFNHPLAGQKLHFAGTIVEVRDASADEISHGHVHGPGGHHH